MKRYRSPAVVLSTRDFRESDKLITFYTRNYGKLRAIAKGAKRSKKRGFAALQPFMHFSIEVVEGKKFSIPRVDSVELLHAFWGIAENPIALGYAGYFCEITDGFSQELEPHPPVYELLVAFLSRLHRGILHEKYLRLFELLSLAGFGLAPNLDNCVAAGRSFDAGTSGFFSPIKGGYVHPDARSRAPDCLPMSTSTRNCLKEILTVDRSRLDTISPSPEVLGEMRRLLPRFLQAQLGRQPKSVRYLIALLSESKSS